ncbi:uncharacterized protein LOC113654746 [Tachysurus fulvidraco]|uniref:uncharacterized protein LOC113654746 n=1 Tax=Tachysurus fulvidraco TaxID=1234273 RepID=UPI001FEF9B17|nr:uncharacterized protein LOC113654746 [Tachysurus fulvidraco]XP_047674046.1 uncharacterized protein LOC113654746 [Tachysurus fulvidraco]XP_047674053.1 uncharacterized protein LOC113654746 [Tachysurus fulvidraco]XP_047674055.1 uncharacterized protein LOC113654746 [Tachysurus fulvidraco]XP_047674064.1 uncharacterized protein LOC113654746 [Tachysurus fulvidraco]XP_047674066.1 uncharacterized protein LOC113654746 [Tachysurus fulvidraco]
MNRFHQGVGVPLQDLRLPQAGVVRASMKNHSSGVSFIKLKLELPCVTPHHGRVMMLQVSLWKRPLMTCGQVSSDVWSASNPPDMSMYRVERSTTINKVDVPYCKCLHGSNSLEGFHKVHHFAARPFQVYLISGIAQWNADRSSDAVFGGKGRRHRIYSATLNDCLNTRCQKLLGETEELLGLEYLFSQSTGESGPFSLQDIIDDNPKEEVVQPGHPDKSEDDEVYHSDVEMRDGVLDVALSRITFTADDLHCKPTGI